MRKMTRKVWSLQRHLVHKYELHHNDIALNQLRHVVWHSFPVVYPDYQREMVCFGAEWEKLKKRKGRWLKYVFDMSRSFDQLYLVSLTFDDETLTTTIFDTRKKRVRDWLNDNTVDYFACVDYGLENGREHYHAIVSFAPQGTAAYVGDPVLLTPIQIGRGTFYRIADPSREWLYGFYSIRAIRSDPMSQRKTAFYALKSASYSFKSAKEEGNAKPFHKRGVMHYADALKDIDF